MNNKNMKQYTGTKTIQACPMTLGEAEQVLNRHIDTSAVENREQVPGYLVRYGDDGDNYQSWSPKEVFERAYKPSETALDRMLIEYDQLKERIMKLQTYILDNATTDPSINLFRHPREQLSHMQDYAKALASRIITCRQQQMVENAKKAIEARKQKEAEEKHKQLQSLVGMIIVEAGRCDSCASEPTDCKKLILADGSHICLKDLPVESEDVPDSAESVTAPAL